MAARWGAVTQPRIWPMKWFAASARIPPRPQGALSEGRRTTTLDKIHQRAKEQCS
jgi:hypothetical protein